MVVRQPYRYYHEDDRYNHLLCFVTLDINAWPYIQHSQLTACAIKREMRYAELASNIDTHPFWDMHLFHNIDQSFERYHLNSHYTISDFTRDAIMSPIHISTLMKCSSGLLEVWVCTYNVCWPHLQDAISASRCCNKDQVFNFVYVMKYMTS
jgi:hypothetical protein